MSGTDFVVPFHYEKVVGSQRKYIMVSIVPNVGTYDIYVWVHNADEHPLRVLLRCTICSSKRTVNWFTMVLEANSRVSAI